MREIVLDTETTGLDPRGGDRIVEIGAVELFNGIPTGETFHAYVNPERPMPAEAFAVHGLGDEFLRTKPVFRDVAPSFLEFLAADRLVIHNATFDIGFINMELKGIGAEPVGWDRVVDTLALARRKHPGAPNSLDALCARYGIDNARRTRHGALLDSEILAEVYLELIGGRQAALFAAAGVPRAEAADFGVERAARTVRLRPSPLAARLTDVDRAAHAEFVASLSGSPLWQRYADGAGRLPGTDGADDPGDTAAGRPKRAIA